MLTVVQDTLGYTCTIVTNRQLRHNRPDITVVFPNDQKAFLILEKQTRYSDLKMEVGQSNVLLFQLLWEHWIPSHSNV